MFNHSLSFDGWGKNFSFCDGRSCELGLFSCSLLLHVSGGVGELAFSPGCCAGQKRGWCCSVGVPVCKERVWCDGNVSCVSGEGLVRLVPRAFNMSREGCLL